MTTLLTALAFGACDDEVAPEPPKSGNTVPESFLLVQSDSLAPLLYRVPLGWFGSDADGRGFAYRHRWTCESLSSGNAAPFRRSQGGEA